MSNTSATGGYLQPAAQGLYPGNLTFRQFMSTVFAGISGLDPTLVRPSWQIDPPKQPDQFTNWMAFGVNPLNSDPNSSVTIDESNVVTSARSEELEFLCSFYGPNSESIGSTVRDGFQIPQNLEALRAANMGFKETSLMRHTPELVGELWNDKWIMSVVLRRVVQRVYPILTFASASGTIKTQVGSPPAVKTINVSVQES